MGPLAVRDMAGRAHGVFGSGTPGSPSGNSWRVGPGGYYLNFDDSGTGQFSSINLKVGDSGGSGSPGSNVFSLAFRVRLTGGGAVYGGADGSVELQIGGNGAVTLVKQNTVAFGSASVMVPFGVDVDIGLSYDGSTVNYYINGVPAGSASGVQTFVLAAQYYLGYANNGERVTNGTRIYRLDVWNRPLSAAQFKAWSENPWQIFADTYEESEDFAVTVPGVTLTPIAAALSMVGFTATISQARAIAPTPASLTLTGYTPTITQPLTLAPVGAALTLTGNTPLVSQVMPQTIMPAGAVLALTGGTPGVMQGSQAPAPGGGGGAGPVREVRRFADMLDRAQKPTRSQKKARRQQLEAEALELLPNLPEAENLAPIAARIVFEQEARAMAPLYADRTIQAMAPVVMRFDAGAALRELIAHLVAEAQADVEDEFDIELLLLGS